MLALLALAVLSPSPHDVGAPTATPDAVRPRVADHSFRSANGGNFATAAIVKWALVEAGQCLNQVGQGQYQISNAPTFLRSVVSSFPLLPLLSFCLEWFCEFPFFKYPRALEALRLNARSVRGLLAFNLSHACSS